jgi:hypothetical protein
VTAHLVLNDGLECGHVIPDPNCVRVSNLALDGLGRPLSLGLGVLSREVGGADRSLAPEGGVAAVMVVEVEPAVKCPGAFAV